MDILVKTVAKILMNVRMILLFANMMEPVIMNKEIILVNVPLHLLVKTVKISGIV